MTVLYGGEFLNSIQHGNRESKKTDSYVSSTSIAMRNVVDTGRLNTALTSKTRDQGIKRIYGSTTRIGMLVSPVLSNPNRVFRVTNKVGIGIRKRRISESDFLLAQVERGLRDNKILSGVSGVGVGYMPSTSTTPTEEKKIRRWPRDWHGENMN